MRKRNDASSTLRRDGRGFGGGGRGDNGDGGADAGRAACRCAGSDDAVSSFLGTDVWVGTGDSVAAGGVSRRPEDGEAGDELPVDPVPRHLYGRGGAV